MGRVGGWREPLVRRNTGQQVWGGDWSSIFDILIWKTLGRFSWIRLPGWGGGGELVLGRQWRPQPCGLGVMPPEMVTEAASKCPSVKDWGDT